MKLTSPLWYLTAFFIALGGAVLAIVVAAGAWDPVREATVTPIGEPVDGTDKSIAVYTDIVQPDRKVTCHAKGPGKKVVTIPAAKLSLTVTNGTDEWHLIGLLTEGDKDQLITCTPRDRRVDDATYTYAAVSGFASKGNAGKGIAILSTTIGVVLAGFTFYTRRKQRNSP
ncbi:MAG: hypothetical protein ABIN55_06740 [Aeromicrobium sp.]